MSRGAACCAPGRVSLPLHADSDAPLDYLDSSADAEENRTTRKIRESAKAQLGGGRKNQAASGEFYHLTQEEYDQMLADPDCDTDLFESETQEILEKKRFEPELVVKIREDIIRKAGLGHWIDM